MSLFLCSHNILIIVLKFEKGKVDFTKHQLPRRKKIKWVYWWNKCRAVDNKALEITWCEYFENKIFNLIFSNREALWVGKKRHFISSIFCDNFHFVEALWSNLIVINPNILNMTASWQRLIGVWKRINFLWFILRKMFASDSIWAYGHNSINLIVKNLADQAMSVDRIAWFL